MSDVNMRILLSASQGNTLSVISGVTSALTGSSGLGGALLGIGVAAGALAVGLGVQAVKASGDFQQAMLLNVAHAGLAKDQMNGVSQSILSMAPALGQMPTDLAQALYPVLSSFSGISDSSAKAKISLVELKDAGESVAGTTTSVTSVTNAASAAFNAFGMTSTDTNTNITRMNNLFDIMNSTVSAGNMQWSNYSTVIGKLSVGAHGAGVSFIEENSALADLTNQGYSAQLAGTYLNNTFTTMYTKADTVAKNAHKLGLTFDETKYKSLDLAGRIQYLNTATDGNQASLLKVLNGNSTALKTFDALSNSISGYKSNLDALNHSQGATADAFATASSGFNFAMQKLQAAGQVLLITIGSQLLPILTNVANAFLNVTNATNPLNILIRQLADGWTELQDSVDVKGIVGALKDFSTSTEQARSQFQLFLPFINNFNNLLINIVGSLSGSLIPIITIASQVFNGWWGYIKLVMFAIEGDLFPAIQNLVTALAPLIQGMLSWVANSKLIPVYFTAIGTAVSTTIGILSNLINVVSSVVMWFNKNHDAATLLLIPLGILGGYFLALAVTSIAAFLATIPAMIAGFLTGAAAAWTMAAGVIAATWPFLLAGAIIGAVVAIIILAITHWGAIVAWLTGVWSTVSGFFTDLWGKVTGTFQKVVGDVTGFVTGLWGNVVGLFQGGVKNVSNTLGTIGNFFKNAGATAAGHAKSGWDNVVGAYQDGNQKVLDAGKWLYDHNYYVKAVVDKAVELFNYLAKVVPTIWNTITRWLAGAWQSIAATATTIWNAVSGAITTAVQAVWNWLVGAWNTITGWLTVAWNAVSGVATTAWNAVTGAIQTAVNAVWNWLVGIWNTASTWLSSKWNAFADLAKTAWNLVSGVFSSIWTTYISKPLGDAYNSITKWFTDLGTSALNSGKNFIQMLVNGIKSGAGAIWDAVTGIASNIWKGLGFHSPTKEGPGSDADKWMPNLVSMLSTGLIGGVPKMQVAVNAVAQPLTTLSHGPTPSTTGYTGPANTQSSGGTTIINVTVNGFVGNKRDVVDWIEKDLDSRLRRSGVLSTSTSGGKAGY